ncbi:TetR/AcrR family transcriptional regulator [Yoonia sp. MH D7]
MAGKVAERRKVLRDDLVNIAEAAIARDGLIGLRARDLATQAGCALGAIYNVFGDLNDLVLAVNARTFRALGAQVAASLAHAPQDPTERLIIMGHAYHEFAAQHHNLWRALFDLDRAEGVEAPDWYLTEMGQLFTYIHDPLAALNPKMAPDELMLLTKALFSSVHGIVLLGLDEANAGVRTDNIDAMISLILKQMTGAKPLW